MMLEIKGSKVWKNKNIPVIFISNKPLDEIYIKEKDTALMRALMARFVIVQVTTRSPILATAEERE